MCVLLLLHTREKMCRQMAYKPSVVFCSNNALCLLDILLRAIQSPSCVWSRQLIRLLVCELLWCVDFDARLQFAIYCFGKPFVLLHALCGFCPWLQACILKADLLSCYYRSLQPNIRLYWIDSATLWLLSGYCRLWVIERKIGVKKTSPKISRKPIGKHAHIARVARNILPKDLRSLLIHHNNRSPAESPSVYRVPTHTNLELIKSKN